MKISVTTYGFESWGGGLDFIRYVCDNLSYSSENSSHEIEILIPDDDLFYRAKVLIKKIKHISSVKKLNQKFNYSSNRDSISSSLKDTGLKLTVVSSRLSGQYTYAKNNNRLIFPCIAPIKNDIPWVGYIYDFQHKHMPELFSEDEIVNRDKHFSAMLNTASHIIVNSRQVISDARKYYGQFKAKLHPLPFSPCPKSEWRDIGDIRNNYGLEKRYFIICNQFWRHKDHVTALNAFSKLIKKYPDIVLVCTGATNDYRHPEYFSYIQELIVKLGIANFVMILGYVPKAHQISLMKNSIALVQPTLFEGGPGGGAVYDAIALGVPCVVSDITVNKEISCGNVSFFHAGDSIDLAEKMELVLQNESERNTQFDQLMTDGLNRKRICGNYIISVLDNALEEFNNDR